MGQAALQQLLDRFRRDASDRVVLVGVLGGRLTEGVDYPGDLLQRMLIMGVPYPRPSARNNALIRHFDRHGSGWKTVVHDPTGRTLRQAIGRLIRSEEDEGTAVVLDDRVMRFRDHLPRLRMATGAEGCVDDPPTQQEGFVRADHV